MFPAPCNTGRDQHNTMVLMVLMVLMASLAVMAMVICYDHSFQSSTAEQQPSFSSHGSLYQQQQELDEWDIGNVYETRREENRTILALDEFWLPDTKHQSTLPFALDFTPPDDSWGAFEPQNNCPSSSSLGFPTKIVFCNIVRTEADWVQDFLRSYASTCHAGYASVGMFIRDALNHSFVFLSTHHCHSFPSKMKQPCVRDFLGNPWLKESGPTER